MREKLGDDEEEEEGEEQMCLVRRQWHRYLCSLK